jgi:nucleotide-binding universal stress UspA family protein
MQTLSPNARARDVQVARTLEVALRHQRPVICAVDDDDLAADVLASAAVLSAQLTVPLIVVHSPIADVFLVGEARRAALDQGNAFLDELTAGYGVDERIVELNDPMRLVVDVAKEGATMIVIGSRGRTGLRAALLGSVSQNVIGSAECPVLVVAPAEPGPGAAPKGAVASHAGMA